MSSQSKWRTEHEFLREKWARKFGFDLYTMYAEKHVAHYLTLATGLKADALKKQRQREEIPHQKLGSRTIRFWGYHIADYLIFGDRWKRYYRGGLLVEPDHDDDGGSSACASPRAGPTSDATAKPDAGDIASAPLNASIAADLARKALGMKGDDTKSGH